MDFRYPRESADVIKEIEKFPNVCLEGMFTHFAKADELDKTFSEEQYRKFLWMRDAVEKEGFRFPGIIVTIAQESLIFQSGSKIWFVPGLRCMECIHQRK